MRDAGVTEQTFEVALRNGAEALYRALDVRRNDRADRAQMTPEDEVLLLHVME